MVRTGIMVYHVGVRVILNFGKGQVMSFNWISTALLSAAVQGLVNTVDSHLISRRMPSFRAYMLPVGVMMLGWSIVLVYLFPLPQNTGTWPLLAAVAAGIIRSTSVIMMLYVLRREEVSRVVPIINTYPIFVAVMAVPLLGETLDYRQWLAIAIVVAGVVIVSVKRDSGRRFTSMGRTLLLLLGASFLLAAADVITKYALSYYSSWNMYSLTHFSLAGIFILFSLRPQVLKELINWPARNSALGIMFINEIIGVLGVVLFYLAVQSGPVSLVSTIFSSRPLFVFLIAFIVSRFSPALLEWQTEKSVLTLRFFAIVLIVGGVAIIYLT